MIILRILIGVLLYTIFSAGLCAQNYLVSCATEGCEITDVAGLKEYKGRYSLNRKSAYLFVASKDGFRAESLLITSNDQKKSKSDEFTISELRKFPSKSTIGKYIYGYNMKWETPEMVFTERYIGQFAGYNNGRITQLPDSPVTEYEEMYGDLNTMLDSELTYMGLTDTSKSAIQDNNSRCQLEVTVRKMEFEYAQYATAYGVKWMNLARLNAKMLFTLKDAFGVDVFSKELDVRSIIYMQDRKVNYLLNALQVGIMNFLDINELKEAIIKREEEANNVSEIPTLNIPPSDVYASSIPQFLQSAVTLYAKDGHGSGCIISADGYIITNYHVVGKDSIFQVILNRGDTVQAKVVRTDWKYDLSLLKAPLNDEIAFRISGDSGVGLADKVYALGTPADVTLGQTISSGIISARRNFFGRDYYQTDARVNGGNSGGALVNEKGELIGVVCSKIIGVGIEGVGFVIPSKYIFERLRISVN